MRVRSALCASLFVGASVVTLAGTVMGSPVGAAPSAQVQPDQGTAPPTTGSQGSPVTTQNLLDGTPTTVAAAATTAPSTSPTTRVADDNRRVWLVVAGLVLVAVLLALLTIWYWVRTRPATVAAGPGRPRPGRDHGSPGPTAGGNGRSVAGPPVARRRPADGPEADRPAGRVGQRQSAGRMTAVRRARDLRG